MNKISIDYSQNKYFHTLSISDNGIGILKEHIEKIFNAFQRGPTSKGKKGSGLGLAIVKEAAKKHYGNAWVESEPGKETTFFITISKNLEPNPR